MAEWNRTLESRVAEQVQQLERIGRLRRYLAPQIADLIMASGDEARLQGHRREVTVVFSDIRSFTPFAEASEPEEVMGVLREYHAAMGSLISELEGTVGHFAGDGMMIFFNDPIPRSDHVERALYMTIEMRKRMIELKTKWNEVGYELDQGIGVTLGYATIGTIGYEGRLDYSAIGNVVNMAARLCGHAKGGQILTTQRVAAMVQERIEMESIGEVALKGLRPVPAFNVLEARSHRGRPRRGPGWQPSQPGPKIDSPKGDEKGAPR